MDYNEALKIAFKQNKWINGWYDYQDGDIMAPVNAEEQFSKVATTNSLYQLYEWCKKGYTGAFAWNNILILNHWDYGTFVYNINCIEKGYIEHLTVDAMSVAEFIEYMEKLNSEC